MNPIDNLLARLPDARPSGKGWLARCPAHDDRKASLSIAEADGRTVLVKCHAGCATDAILSAVEMRSADLFPPKGGSGPKPKPSSNRDSKPFSTASNAVAALERKLGKRSDLWIYHNAIGEPVGIVVRWNRPDGGKEIRPVALHPDGWHIGAMPEPRPLYGLGTLAAASRVIVCEGEKATDAARKLGFVATTSAGGAGAAAKTDWEALAGKEVVVLPDNDSVGRVYAETIAATLGKLTPAATVRIVSLPNLPDGGDLVDWIAAQEPEADSNELRRRLEAMIEAVEPETAEPETAQPPVDRRPFEPFPVAALPEPIREFVAEGARAIGCDPSYLALPLLTALAAAIGNARCLELKRQWRVPSILWSAIVGDSGTSKSVALRLVLKPFHRRNHTAVKAHTEAMKQYENALEEWHRQKSGDGAGPRPAKPVAERYVVEDVTIESLGLLLAENPRGLLSARDELATWFGSFDKYSKNGDSDAGKFLSLYNAEHVLIDRKSCTPPTQTIPRASVSICGGIQPAILKRVLTKKHQESGLAARIVLAYPPHLPKRWTNAEIDHTTEARLDHVVDRLYGLQADRTVEGDAVPVCVRLNPEAQAAWIAYFNSHNLEQGQHTGAMGAAWSKLEEIAPRLALVIHHVVWAASDRPEAHNEPVSLESFQAALRLTAWFKNEAKRVYAMLAESVGEGDDRRLIEFLLRKGGNATVRETQQGCGWLKKTGAAELALENLVKAGRGGWQSVPTNANGGRPSRRFILHERSVFYETPSTSGNEKGSVDVDGAEAETDDGGSVDVDGVDADVECNAVRSGLDSFPNVWSDPNDP